MNRLLLIILVLIGIVLLRYIINMVNYLRIKRYHRYYVEYTKNPSDKINEYKSQIIALFKGADVPNQIFEKWEFAPYGRQEKMRYDVFFNLHNTNSDFVIRLTQCFHNAIGVYRYRMLSSLNPLYWVDVILKLPQYLIKYVSGSTKEDKIIFRIVNLLYWILGIIYILNQLNVIKFGGE